MYLLIAASHFLFIILIFLASLLWPANLWSVSWWGLVSLPALVLLSLFSIVFISSKPSEFIRKRSSRPTFNKSLYLFFTLSVSAILLWVFRFKQPLYGDMHSTAEAITEGTFNLPGAFISTSINQLFYRVVNRLFLLGGIDSLSLASIISGLLFMITAYYTTGIIFEKSFPGRSLLALLLISNGCFAIFFGGGGNIPIAALLSFLYIVSVIKYLKSNGNLILPALLLALSLMSHPSAIYLLPGFIYIIFTGFLSEDKRAQTGTAAGIVIGLWIIAETICPLISESAGPAKYITDSVTSSFRQWNLAGSLLNITNSALIIGPVFLSFLLLFIPARAKEHGVKKPDRLNTLLLITVISAILLIISGSGGVDGGIQWSLLISAGPVFSLYLIVRMKKIDDTRYFFKIALLVTVSGLIHLIPIIIVNSSSTAAEQRLLSLPLREGRSEFIIGDLARENHNLDKASKYYYKATEKDSDNDMAFYNLAEIKLKEKKYSTAITFFSKAIELKPDNQNYRFRQAEAYIETKWFSDAIPILEDLTTRFGDSASYWTKLGEAFNRSKDFPKAADAYEKALAIDPANNKYKDHLAIAIINWGVELQANNKIDDARKKFLKAVKLSPNRSEGYTNLAAIELGKGNYEKARKLLVRAMRNPNIDARTYLVMGLVMEKLGNNDKAIYYLKECKKINPMSPAGYHIRRIKAVMEGKTNE